MNNQNSFLKSMAGSAKTGTWVFGIFAILELASMLVERIFNALSVPVWNARDRYIAKQKASEEEIIETDEYPTAEEMFATLSAELQLRFVLSIEDKRGGKGVPR